MLRTTVLVVLLFASAGFGYLSRVSAADQPRETLKGGKKAVATYYSTEKEAARLTVRVPKKVVAGSSLPIEAKVENRGNIPFVVNWWTPDPMKFDVKLTTKSGKPVPFTAYGQKEFAPTDPHDREDKACGSFRGHYVSPGETYGMDVPNLALFYDLTLPGDYVLMVSKTICTENAKSKDVELKVEKIPFTIEP